MKNEDKIEVLPGGTFTVTSEELNKALTEATRRGKAEGLEEALQIVNNTPLPKWHPSLSEEHNIAAEQGIAFFEGRLQSQLNSRIQQYGKEE